MSNLNTSNGETPPLTRNKPNMKIEQRKEIASFFLIHSQEGPDGLKPKHGALTIAAKKFNISHQHASKLYWKGKKKYDEVGSFTLTPERSTGRPRKYNADDMREEIRVLSPRHKKSLRALGAKLGLCHATLRRYKVHAAETDNLIIIPHTNPIKPELTPMHEAWRVLYARSRLNLHDGKYDGLYLEIHVDEKWFFLSESDLRMYITPGEKVPRRTTPHKSHILKVMFLCAVARPRFGKSRVESDVVLDVVSDGYSPCADGDGNCTFDGKIRLWPFLVTEQAKRSSKNRPAGTLEEKPVTNQVSEFCWKRGKLIIPWTWGIQNPPLRGRSETLLCRQKKYPTRPEITRCSYSLQVDRFKIIIDFYCSTLVFCSGELNVALWRSGVRTSYSMATKSDL